MGAMTQGPDTATSLRDRIDAIEAIDTIANVHDAHTFLRDETLAAGYPYFILATLPSENEQRVASHIIVTNLPDAFLAEFDDHSLAANSAIFATLRRSVRPLAWNLEETARSRTETARSRLVGLFTRHGITAGLHLPIHNRSARRGFVAILGDRSDLSFDDISRLTLIGTCVFDRLTVGADMRHPMRRLTGRERETLVWTAAGKTSAEIGMILGLSEHTVNQYIASASHKLGAANRAHAVAQAIRTHLIE